MDTIAPVPVAPRPSDEQRVLELVDELLAGPGPDETGAEHFLGRQFDLGLAWVHFPEGAGGLGLPRALQRTVDRRTFAAGGPNPSTRNPIGYGMAAPTLVAHGTPEQRRRLLRPLFTGEELWCQLFSEPGAGSDLASLAARAVRDGNEWVVNGQKVWTTLAHVARWGLLLARTDADVPKHAGLTYFVVDMRARGVEVRPLHQMTGEAEFNEVFLADVRVPDGDRIDEVGRGWQVARTTLMNERVSIGDVPRRGGGLVGTALELWRTRGPDDPVRRDALMALYARAQALRLTNARAARQRAAGHPGPEGSIAKLMSAELNRDIAAFTVDLLAADGMLQPGGYPMSRPAGITSPRDPQHSFLRMQANTIEGGTSNVLRNILGEQVLGLPREPAEDRGTPWSHIRRS